MNDALHVPRPAMTPRTRWRSSQPARIAMLGCLLVALWMALLLAAASIPHGASLQPEHRLRHDGADFAVVAGVGAGIAGDRLLNIASIGSDHMAVQVHAPAAPIEARDFPVLRYRWHRFPQTLELSFMFRREDAPADVQTITLPPAGHYPAYFNLADIPAWQGRITEIGFAEYPTAQLVPPDTAFRPFALVEAELWSPSWRGSLGALATDWFAYRPWALMSVSALGPDAPWPHRVSPVVMLTLGLFASVLLIGTVLRRGRHWIGGALCIALGAGWLLLDLRWLVEFSARTALTHELHADQSWSERSETVPDRELLVAAQRVQALLSKASPATRVIVAADNPYTMLRLDYHLLPANAAPVSVLDDAAAARHFVVPTWLVTFGTARWRYDETTGILHGPGIALAASALLEDADLRVYRLGGGVR